MRTISFLLTVLLTVPLCAQSEREMTQLREQMVHRELVKAGIRNPDVLEVMRTTPRHKFMPPNVRDEAYLEKSLPIGFGQTISSPFVVASMTEALNPQPSDRVLEIGTGSGYQAAVLSPLVDRVYTIEIVEPLARKAQKVLKTLKYKNVYVKAGDGYAGWPDAAPFDKIIVTCSPESPPPALIEQLKEGGLMCIPLGERYAQNLCVLKKVQGRLETQPIRPILFVPMTGDAEKRRKLLPDPANPVLLNGDFEDVMVGKHDPKAELRSSKGSENEAYETEDAAAQTPRKTEVPEVWCYLRQAQVVDDGDAPSGKYCLKFQNQKTGVISQACQGMGVDGRKVSRLKFTMDIRGEGLYPDVFNKGYAGVFMVFIDDRRNPVRSAIVGGWRGTFDWKTVSVGIDVPQSAREALFYIGLNGARGTLWVDKISTEVER
ncbi:MAG: protein-L-isoaspartate(D-aspartate) O-methyltransferase [Planctomycetia bacterium]|nr:protein-L-isoaspartate(D-aspartate) O-methyltransferase [Planctomycetia bacterium]